MPYSQTSFAKIAVGSHIEISAPTKTSGPFASADSTEVTIAWSDNTSKRFKYADINNVLLGTGFEQELLKPDGSTQPRIIRDRPFSEFSEYERGFRKLQ